MMRGIGDNQGPTLEKGHKWRSFQWQKARLAAMPKTMPLMVVKMHVARARALRLDYATYAAVRKASGRDIMGLLFSSNALRVVRREEPHIPVMRGEIVSAVTGAKRLALVHAPLRTAEVQLANECIDAAGIAPKFTQNWSDMRDHLEAFISDQKLAKDQVLIIGDTSFERDWTTAAQAAGYVDAERYFGS
jgi:hypothetical protein